jgi:hypothetical protein
VLVLAGCQWVPSSCGGSSGPADSDEDPACVVCCCMKTMCGFHLEMRKAKQSKAKQSKAKTRRVCKSRCVSVLEYVRAF